MVPALPFQGPAMGAYTSPPKYPKPYSPVCTMPSKAGEFKAPASPIHSRQLGLT